MKNNRLLGWFMIIIGFLWTLYYLNKVYQYNFYAEFTQSDPRDYNIEQRNDIQVLQIDVDDYIMFGDSGLGHIFISQENLIKKDFSKAYFYWDCC